MNPKADSGGEPISFGKGKGRGILQRKYGVIGAKLDSLCKWKNEIFFYKTK